MPDVFPWVHLFEVKHGVRHDSYDTSSVTLQENMSLRSEIIRGKQNIPGVEIMAAEELRMFDTVDEICKLDISDETSQFLLNE